MSVSERETGRSDDGGLRVLDCRVADARYAVSMTSIVAIHAVEKVQAEGGLHGWLASSDGRRIPVTSLAVLLGHATTDSWRTGRVVLFRDRDAVWGLKVDRVAGAESVGADALCLLPVLERCVPLCAGAVVSERGMAPLLAIEPIRDAVVRSLEAAAVSETFSSVSASAGSTPSAKPLWDRVRELRALVPRGHRTPGVVSFRASERSDLRFGLSFGQVSEILEFSEPSPLPWGAPHIKGLVKRRGRPAIMVDLGERFGFGATPSPSRTLVARTAWAQEIAIPVLSEIRMHELTGAPVRSRAMPDEASPELVRGVFELGRDGDTLVIPDLERATAPP